MSVPNLKEIEWAISELEKEETSFSNYAKLANLYTVRDKLLGGSTPEKKEPDRYMEEYSQAAAPEIQSIRQYGDSDFLLSIVGKDPGSAWIVINELMDNLQVVNPRVYDSVMRKLKRI